MALTLRVLAPDQSVFDGNADEVILPSTTGQLGILPGHVSLLTALDFGVLRVREGNGWQAIALQGGFAEVDADEVTVLVNAAELGNSINPDAAGKELDAATAALAKSSRPTRSVGIEAASSAINSSRSSRCDVVFFMV